MMKVTRYFCIFMLCAAFLSAQSFYGSLRGRVSDPDGAVIPGVLVTLTDENTQLTRTTVSTGAGEYIFPSLTPGTYKVSAQSPGFKMIERNGIVVSTQAAVTVDLALEIGEVSEQVYVTAETPLLETASASTGTVVDRQKLVDLPNLGRNPFMMSKLSEGVVQTGNPKFNRMQDQSGSSSISIAGGPVRGNNYTLDGVSITDSSNRAVIIPTVEAVEEVKVQANTYDAEMGRTGGGTFNTTLRSGTNRFQAAVFGYIRQTSWLANNFFSNRAGTPIIDQPFRNYGGSIGGPIVIPKVYDGRNKTFFWIAGEAYRQTESAGTRLSVPTMLERNGDFSQSLSRNSSAAAQGGLQTIYDPLTTTESGTRTPFPGNVIPSSRISPAGLAIGSYYPQPNVTAAFYGDNNLDVTVPAFNRADQMSFKVDHEFFTWWKMNASYLHYGSQEPGNQWFGSVATPNQNVLFRKVDTTQVNSTFLPTPTLVVTVRYGFNRFPNFSAPISRGFDLGLLKLPQSYTSLVSDSAFPEISMTNLESFGSRGTITQNVLHSRAWNVTASKFLGSHNLKFGFDYRQMNDDRKPTVGPGTFEFNEVFTRADPQSAVTGSGSSMASLLLGYPSGGDIQVGSYFYNYIRYYGAYVQDDWRVNSNLTLNFGLRYEYETAPRDANNNFIVGFDPTAPSPLQQTVSDPQINGTLLYAGVDGNGVSAGDPRTNKFGPRFGFAYTINSRTVIRGGYGLFWAPATFSAQQTLGYSQTTPIVASYDNNFTPAVTLDNPYPNGLLAPVGNAERGYAGIGQSITAPDQTAGSAGYVQQYSFDLQHEIPGWFVVSAGYIGSRSDQLHQNRSLNQVDPTYYSLGSALNDSVNNPMYNAGGVLAVGNSTITRSQLLRPFPQFLGVTLSDSDVGYARYNSFYAKVQRRLSQGLTGLVTYTWSKKMELNSSWQNIYDLSGEYALSSSDQPHRLSIAATYELPFGLGKPLASGSRALDAAIGGWSLNVVGVLASGAPLAISQTNTNSGVGANQRPNATGLDPHIDGSVSQKIDQYLNIDAFSVAPQYTFGNLSPYISERGPAWMNWDASLFKTFSVTERFKAQFRAESMNVTNTPYFNNPNTSITSPSFGRITSQRNFSRLIQLGVRVFF